MSLPRCTAEDRKCIDLQYDKETNTTRRVYVPPSADEKSQLEAVSDNLRRRLSQSPSGTVIVFAERLSHLWFNSHTPEGWKVVYRQFEADLCQFSYSHIKEAFEKHRKTGKFFPTISEIFLLCDELRAIDQKRLDRVQSLLAQKQPTASKPGPRSNGVNNASRLKSLCDILRTKNLPKQKK